MKKLAILVLLMFLPSCAWLMTGSSQMSVEDAVKLTKAEGGSGCTYLRVTGAYPGFATGVAIVIRADDSKGKVSFLDCLNALSPDQRGKVIKFE